MTIMFWAKIAALGAPATWYITTVFNPSGYSFQIAVNAAGNIVAGTYYGEVVSSTPIAANTWAHLAFTWDGTTIRLYMNRRSGRQRPEATPARPTSWSNFHLHHLQGRRAGVR